MRDIGVETGGCEQSMLLAHVPGIAICVCNRVYLKCFESFKPCA